METSKATHFATADGSSTLCSARFGAHYHSLHGAITESEHVFINAGLKTINTNQIDILEVGFGTGLNAALTASYAMDNGLKISYTSLELFPLSSAEYNLLNFPTVLPSQAADLWRTICSAPWDQENRINDGFLVEKLKVDFTKWIPNKKFNLVYFDAFAPNDQPEMWEEMQFIKIYDSMHPNAILVTYCVKGIVKNALTSAGFSLERLPGPPGKRHMLRARKLSY
jgi:tRNA U34 5-methylaminomethyl-2-thiouridine-forming methyltransferase MnmC